MLYGRELRILRKAAGLSAEQLGALTNLTGSAVGAYERGERRPGPKFSVVADELLDGRGALTRLYEWMCLYAPLNPDWFESLLDAERKAKRIRVYQPQTIAGLLQTEDYARLLFTRARVSIDEAEQYLATRIKRRDVLSGPTAPHYWAVMDEAVFLRLACHPDVARGQIEHLLEVAELPHMMIEILPISSGLHACTNGGFVLLAIPEVGECAYIEGPGAGHLTTEMDDVVEVERRYDLVRAETLSRAESIEYMRALLESHEF